jgi:hypothetical protein
MILLGGDDPKAGEYLHPSLTAADDVVDLDVEGTVYVISGTVPGGRT